MKINDPAAFGEAIRQRRKALHYTQAHVAAVTGFSVSFISDMERGKATAERGKALSLSALESMREKVESQILMRRSCFLRQSRRASS